MGSSSEEFGDGNWTSSGTGTSSVTCSTGRVWYDWSVGGDDGGVPDDDDKAGEAFCCPCMSSA